MFWERVKAFFWGPQEDHLLALKRSEEECAQLAQQLHNEKERLRLTLNSELFPFVCEVVDPLLRAFQTNVSRGGGVEEKRARHSIWLTRAQKTLRLFGQSEQSQRFKEKLVALLVDRTYLAIDQD